MACSTPMSRASSRSSASISGPMMKRWLSQTRVTAARISSRSGRYCACKSSSGTPDTVVIVIVREYGSAPRLDRGARFAVRVAPLHRFALVVILLAPRQADGHLYPAVLEVHADRDQRHPFFDRLANQLPDLLAMQEQLATPERLVIGVAAVRVRADVHVVEEHLPIFDPREAVAKVDAALADRLHLGAEQRDTRFERL